MDLAHQFRTLGFGRSVQASRNASSNTAVVTGKAEVGLFGVKLMYNALLVEVNSPRFHFISLPSFTSWGPQFHLNERQFHFKRSPTTSSFPYISPLFFFLLPPSLSVLFRLAATSSRLCFHTF